MGQQEKAYRRQGRRIQQPILLDMLDKGLVYTLNQGKSRLLDYSMIPFISHPLPCYGPEDRCCSLSGGASAAILAGTCFDTPPD